MKRILLYTFIFFVMIAGTASAKTYYVDANAGNDSFGGTKEKPIGLVYISVGYKDKIKVIKYISQKAQTNNRYEIKKDIVEYALLELLTFLKNTFN